MCQQGDSGEIRNPRATGKDLDSGDENTVLQLSWRVAIFPFGFDMARAVDTTLRENRVQAE